MIKQEFPDKQAKPLLVVGSAPRLFFDLRFVPPAGHFDVMAINQACIMYLLPIRYLASYHPELAGEWVAMRDEMGGNTDFTPVYFDREAEEIPERSGSSTLYGVLKGLDMGYDRILIAGAPLDDQGYMKFRAGWMDAQDRLRGKVRSMSGWTRGFLESL